MANFTRHLLSGSTDGDPIKVAATATPGTAIHTAIAGSTSFDEVYLWATNTDTVTRTVSVEWGGATDPDHLICKAVDLPPKSPPILLIDGISINNAGTVKAFASAANVVLVSGHINRIS